jgi:hypothetical protein
VCKADAGGQTAWCHTIASGTGDVYANRVAVDSKGHVYVAGYFTFSVDFTPNEPGEEYITDRWGDEYLLKVNRDGVFQWVKVPEEPGGGIVIVALGIDRHDHIVVVGSFGGTVDFDTGAGRDARTYLNESPDGFIWKLSRDGKHLWVGIVASRAWDRIEEVSIDPEGNVYAFGWFRGTFVDLDPTFEYDTRFKEPLSAFANSFVVKVRPDGSYAWGRTWPDGITGFPIIRAAAGAGGAVVQHLVEPEIVTDLLKFGPDGTLQWRYRPAEKSADASVFFEDLAFHPGGDILGVGVFRGTLDFNPLGVGLTPICPPPPPAVGCNFILRLDPEGRLGWVYTTRGVGGASSSYLVIDADGVMHVNRSLYSGADADPTCGVDVQFHDAYQFPYLTELICNGADGDYNADGVVDLADFARFQTCFQPDPAIRCADGCDVFDMTPDRAIDTFDLAELYHHLAGPRQPR